VARVQARRVLDYNSIVTEVTQHMSGRFQPLPLDIKKRIESLIERDFLERDEADRTTYRYIS
jgi:cullin 3